MEVMITAIGTYALRMAITLMLLYVPYIFLLRKHTLFRTSRVTLLFVLLLSLILPFVDVPLLHIGSYFPIYSQIVDVAIIADVPLLHNVLETVPAAERLFSVEELMCYFIYLPYIVVAVIIAIVKVVELIMINANVKRGALWVERKENYTIYFHIEKVAPYSWMRNVVINEEDYNLYGDVIILHEEGHVIQRHSWDMLLVALVEVLQWFNPFVYMLSSDLKDVHEYEADAYVLQRRKDTRAYQMLIIKKAVDHASYTLVNSFNQSNLKKRITMMLKKKSNPCRCATMLYILPAMLVALCLFASPQKVIGNNAVEEFLLQELTPAKVVNPMQKNDTVEGPICEVCDVMPEFPGGHVKLFQYLGKNTVYPQECLEAGEQGRSVIQYVVYKDGSIGYVKVVRGSGNERLDKEALRVVKTMPKWIPGKQGGKNVNVKLTIPIMFRLK